MSRKLLSIAFFAMLFVSFAGEAYASHFRFAHNTWRRISDNQDGSVTVEFTSLQAWRTSGLDMLGLDFGDGDSFFPNSSDITDVFAGLDLAGEGYTIRRFVVQHTYSAAAITTSNGQFVVVGSSCCRIGSLINAGGGSERIQTIVDLNGGNTGSPVSGIPVILQLSFGQNNSLALGVADPGGDPFSCRMATSSESEISTLAEAAGNQVAVSSSCVLSWDLSGTTLSDVGSKYAVQIIIDETNHCNGQNSCGGVALDFIIEIVQGNPPACSSDKPVNNTLYSGFPFNANFTGTDSDPGAVLTSTSFGAPAAATFTAGTGASPLAASFSWTPTDTDRGSAQSLLVTYQDETGLQGVCAMSLQVSLTDPVVNCTQVSVTADQFVLDGNALRQRDIAYSAARKLLSLGGSKKDYKSVRKEAQKLYLQAWTIAWSIPGDILDCGSSEYCDNVSTASATSGYVSVVNQLDSLIQSTLSKIQKRGGKSSTKSLKKASASRLAESLSALGNIPASSSSCPKAIVQLNQGNA